MRAVLVIISSSSGRLVASNRHNCLQCTCVMLIASRCDADRMYLSCSCFYAGRSCSRLTVLRPLSSWCHVACDAATVASARLALALPLVLSRDGGVPSLALVSTWPADRSFMV